MKQLKQDVFLNRTTVNETNKFIRTDEIIMNIKEIIKQNFTSYENSMKFNRLLINIS